MANNQGKQSTASNSSPGGFEEDVKEFSSHCAYIRAVYTLATRIWRDSTEAERALMESISPSFFLDIGQVLADYVVLSACRITDPAASGSKNENFTIEYFVDCFPGSSATYKQLDQFKQTMDGLRTKIKPARDKLIAHADRSAMRSGKPLGMATWQEWDGFWSALKSFIRVLNETALGTPFEIDMAGVPGDAEMLLKSLKQSRHFEALLEKGSETVKKACLDVALPACTN